MSSLKMTFSLASLVLIFALVFSTAVVEEAHAQADFEGKTIPDQVFTEDIAITPITLPTAKNADRYTLSQPDGMNFDVDTRVLSGAPNAENGADRAVYNYEAHDDDGVNATISFTIEVKANQAPKFPDKSEIKAQVFKIGKDVESLIDFPTATDPDAGDALTYSISSGNLPPGVQFDPFQQRFIGRPTLENTTAETLTYTATDLDDNAVSLMFDVTVEMDHKPDFATETITDMTVKVDEAIKDLILPEAKDENAGDELTYTLAPSLPAGLEYIQSARLLRGTPTAVQAETEYTYTVTDPDGNTAELKFKITVRVDPVFADSASIRDYTFVVGTEVDAGPFPAATDADDDIDTYSISPEPPDGVEFIASLRKLIGNPTTVQDETEYTYTVTDDAEGTDELEFNITVTAAGTPNAAPVVAINTDAPASAVAAGSFVVAYTVADTDTGDTVTPTATIMVVPSSATAHYSVSEADGMVTITQAEATTMTIPAATVTVTITANDGTVDSEPMMLSVAFAAAMYTPPPLTNVAPVVDITTQAPAEAVTTGSFAVAYDVTDTDTGDTVTPTATIMVVPSSATAHYSVSEADGMVTITQAEATTMTIPAATVTVTITANDGTVDSEPMTLSVAFEAAMYTLPDTGTPALAFSDTSIADRAFTAGTAIGTTAMPYFQLPDATGGQSPYVYTLHRGAGQLDITATGHNGLTVDLADLRLSGSPTAADASGTMFTWRATDANDDVVALNFTITVSPAGAITPPTVKAVATFSGTLSLTGRSIITITFDKAVAALTEADFTVTGGDIPANGIRAKDVTAPTVANTIWEVAIDADPFAQSVSITINSTSTVAQAAAGINGRRDAATPKGTLNLIDAATGADDTAKFVVTLTFAAALPAGTDVVAADLTVTPATAVIGAIASNLDRTVWEVEITPTASSATTVDLSTAGKLKFATGSSYAMLSVATKSTPPSVGDITATKATAAGVTTVTLTGSIAANGFATIGSASLPNLEEFFTIGGTIGVDDGDAADDKNSRSVVVSEILWGLDYGETDIAKQNKHQFIELYNTTSASIDLAGWKLKFTEGRPVPASDIDQVSNRADAGWAVNIGQSGRVTNTTADGDGTSAPINIVSMYRKINYTKVEKVKDADGTADPSREEQLKGIPGANVAGGWAPSIRASANGIFSSKGRKHFATTAILKASFVARSPFIINEVGNGSGDTNDWVEIRNVDPAEKSLNNHHLSYVSGFDTDTSLVNFKDKDIKVPGNGVILLVNTDPKNTGIAAGRNAAVAEADQELTGATSRYYINSNLKLPDDGKFNLILRNAHDKLKASSHFMDVIGGLVVTDNTKGTSLWPLVATGGPHGDVVEANGRDLKSGYVYIRKNAGGGTGEHHLGRAGYTGVGYDRAALKSDANGGTPGYENNAVKGKVAELSAAEITISEIMVDTGEGRQNLAQWIELYNSSMTQAVSLGGWKLAIENANSDVETALNATLSLDGMTISPNQTVLIVSTSGRVSDPDHFPSSRVVNLWTTKKHRDELEMVRRTDQVFSATGFHFKLTDADNKLVDEAGNLDGNRRTRDEIAWEIPTGEDDDRRSSLIRVYDEGVAVKGTSAAGWISADETNLAFAISETYYGDPDDFGTPGFRGGGPLPVSLSKFRPELLDSGEIVVRWITESELNNAGFNILRSETRNGEFTKLNTKLIAGQGTTSERTVYSFPDTSAKPNVVYYYQIQDVSLDGKVQTLRQSRLKGNISADGKLTTTWGEIKALQ